MFDARELTLGLLQQLVQGTHRHKWPAGWRSRAEEHARGGRERVRRCCWAWQMEAAGSSPAAHHPCRPCQLGRQVHLASPHYPVIVGHAQRGQHLACSAALLRAIAMPQLTTAHSSCHFQHRPHPQPAPQLPTPRSTRHSGICHRPLPRIPRSEAIKLGHASPCHAIAPQSSPCRALGGQTPE